MLALCRRRLNIGERRRRRRSECAHASLNKHVVISAAAMRGSTNPAAGRQPSTADDSQDLLLHARRPCHTSASFTRGDSKPGRMNEGPTNRVAVGSKCDSATCSSTAVRLTPTPHPHRCTPYSTRYFIEICSCVVIMRRRGVDRTASHGCKSTFLLAECTEHSSHARGGVQQPPRE